ncbi:PilZ domain-containing protein [Bradyrhizobium roseum]|uniref:PilZ domain-containing protein n=1 Tax=Bradyrhizobium roseum TaxID=3056648 RepID=UPI00263224C0|nr:PilZ domain-containing protein [Bradyrhizobium roseus]WKA31284.1 PilZ domain-containing protein [Bradyrhizobium roseus]
MARLVLNAAMKPPSRQIKRGVRRIRQVSAWIVPPGRDAFECQVMDISANGAKIISAMPSQVPDRFELAFTKDDGKHRLCEVVWRRGKMIGVQFG